MTFNGSKFQLMRYGRNENIEEDTIYFTNNIEEVIEEFEEKRPRCHHEQEG